MSSKKPFKATSPIKFGGTRYEVGEVLNLTEKEAESLHVVPATEQDVKASDKAGKSKPSVSTAMDANDAIAMIEDTPFEKLSGFVPKDEERVTVTRAWDKKKAEAEGESESE